MKNRKTWIITGTIGVLSVGAGAAFASQPSTDGSEPSRTTVSDAPTAGTSTDDDATHGLTLRRGWQTGAADTGSLIKVGPAQPMPDSAITSLTLVSAPSPASADSPKSAPSPASADSPKSAPSAPSAD